MNILALDMAKRTGWAHSRGDSGVVDFGDEETTPLAERLARFREWLHEMLVYRKTDALVYEEAHMRGGPATRSALGFQTVALLAARDFGLAMHGVHTGTLKKHATGNGHASKNDMLVAAIQQHPTLRLQDDNHVDALWLLHWGQSNL